MRSRGASVRTLETVAQQPGKCQRQSHSLLCLYPASVDSPVRYSILRTCTYILQMY